MDTAAPTSPQLDKKPQPLLAMLLINRNHALLRVGMTTSQIGNFIFTTSMLLWITTTLARNAPWAAFAVGALALIPQIIGLLSGTVAGVFVDRWNTRRTLLTMDGTRALILLLLLPATGILPLPFPAGSDAATIFQLVCALLVIAAISVCSPFVNAGLVALIFDIVDEADLGRAFGRGQLLNGLCTIIGPPLAALIFFTLGVQWSIALDIISFAVSFAFLLAIRPPSDKKDAAKKPERKQSSFFHDLIEGLRFVAGNNVLTVVCITITLSTLGLGPITILGIFFVTNNLHSSPQFYPILSVSFGIGALAGAVIAPWLQKKLGLLRSFWLPGLATGALLLIFARLNIFWLACLALALIGISEIVQNVAQGPLMLKATPRKLIGRANAVLGQLATLSTLTSVAIASFLVATPLHDKHLQLLGVNVSTLDMIFMASGVIVFASGLCAVITLRHYGALQAQTASSQETSGEGANTTETSGAGASATPTAPPPPPVRKKLWIITGAGLALAVLLVAPLVFASPEYQGTNRLLLAPGVPASGQVVGGLSCEPVVGTQTHYSIHLSLYANDTALAIPAGIGIVAPAQPGVVALATNGKKTCLYPLHVYETDNLIHVELTRAGTTTLGQFFDIWGQPLNRTQILGYRSDAGQSLTFKIFDANGDPQPFTGDPRSISLTEHETIVVLFQSPHVLPRPFTDWNGV
ncbi:MAG TPA: MFS transporter [Ktedonobacteraceae bacterium]|nr:MFS transporter [Ktedonobacteraceae bacterium]